MIACITCLQVMRPKTIGFEFVEAVKTNGSVSPYKLWSSDLLECPGCHTKIAIVAPRQQPICEHFMPEFAKRSSGAPVVKA